MLREEWEKMPTPCTTAVRPKSNQIVFAKTTIVLNRSNTFCLCSFTYILNWPGSRPRWCVRWVQISRYKVHTKKSYVQKTVRSNTFWRYCKFEHDNFCKTFGQIEYIIIDLTSMLSVIKSISFVLTILINWPHLM
jgi:hypothetical protein